MPTQADFKRFEQRFAKDFGENSLVRGDAFGGYRVVPTGAMTLDFAMGIGGWPLGRISELWGADGTGKTTLALQSIAQAQRAYPDRSVAFIDVERTLDRSWAMQHGVDLAQWYLWEQPENTEEIADGIKAMIASGLFSFVVLDSVAAMVPRAVYDKDADEEGRVGEQAKIVTRMVQVNRDACRAHDTALLLINQVRANISYGADTTTSGGWALKHATTVKVKLGRGQESPKKVNIAGEPIEVGHQIAAQVERNKCAPPRRRCTWWLWHTPTEVYGPVGFDPVDAAFELGKRTGIIKQSGAYYELPNGERFQGGTKLQAYLRERPEVVDQLRQAVLDTRSHEIHSDDEQS